VKKLLVKKENINKILLYIYMFFYHYCDLCNIQLEDKNDYVCKTCFEVLMQECFPKLEESDEEEEKEPDNKKRKTT